MWNLYVMAYCFDSQSAWASLVENGYDSGEIAKNGYEKFKKMFESSPKALVPDAGENKAMAPYAFLKSCKYILNYETSWGYIPEYYSDIKHSLVNHAANIDKYYNTNLVDSLHSMGVKNNADLTREPKFELLVVPQPATFSAVEF